MDTWELNIKPDGTVVTVHNDELDLHELGTVKMRRATSVEWIEDKQCWQVMFFQHVADTKRVFVDGFKKRGDALAFERQVLLDKLAKGEVRIC